MNDSCHNFSHALDILQKYHVSDLLMCDRNAEVVEMYQSAIEKREETIKITTIERAMFNETKGKELVPQSQEI